MKKNKEKYSITQFLCKIPHADELTSSELSDKFVFDTPGFSATTDNFHHAVSIKAEWDKITKHGKHEDVVSCALIERFEEDEDGNFIEGSERQLSKTGFFDTIADWGLSRAVEALEGEGIFTDADTVLRLVRKHDRSFSDVEDMAVEIRDSIGDVLDEAFKKVFD